MLRLKTSNGLFIMGLDAENVRRLKGGEPIKIDLRPMGGTDVIALVYGETLDDIARDIEEQTGQKLPEPTPFNDGKPAEH